MKSYTIHLIRHGVCEGNLEGRYVGRTQSPLAQEGIQALLELKRKGIYPEAKKYYASPCVRCVDTLKVLYPTADPEVILELAECDFGDWENKKAEDHENNEQTDPGETSDPAAEKIYKLTADPTELPFDDLTAGYEKVETTNTVTIKTKVQKL